MLDGNQASFFMELYDWLKVIWPESGVVPELFTCYLRFTIYIVFAGK
jgi:hypothetical protein